MICPTCDGRGYVVIEHAPARNYGWQVLTPQIHLLPCPECEGRCRTHCCEGHRPDGAGLDRLADDGCPNVPDA